MAYRYGKKHTSRTRLYFAIVFILVALTVVGIAYKVSSHSILPANIDKQVKFVVLYPDSSWTVDRQMMHYDTKASVLTINAQKQGTSLIINEQPTPSQFNDIPQYYPALLNKLNQFTSFGTANGTVNLVRPTEVNQIPQAVLNSSGTLVFIKPNKQLSIDDWRTFFNHLRIVK